MTPCEQQGFKVGDKFTIEARECDDTGDDHVLLLDWDDGTTMPQFFDETAGDYCWCMIEVLTPMNASDGVGGR